MELRHLRYFIAVAEEGHVTRAAERLGIQQPPLSQQIQALEAEIEAQLFHRRPRGMELTRAGRALLDEARGIVARVDQALARTRRTAQGEIGKVTVGVTTAVAFHPVVSLAIRRFRDAHPRVAVQLVEDRASELIAGLKGGNIDAVLCWSPFDGDDELAVHHLLEEDLVVALPAGHRLAPRRKHAQAAPLPLRAFAAETFILNRRPIGPSLYDGIIAACHEAGFSPKVSQEAPRIPSALNFVAAGLGAAIVPQSLRHLYAGVVAFRRVKGSPRLKAHVTFAHRRGESAAAVRRFIDLIRRTARNGAGAAAPDVRRLRRDSG
jgi:DNA-binding transcriptional LysR family regulator